MKKLFLGDGGTVSDEAQAEYEAQERLAQAAFDAAMVGAPSRDRLMAPLQPAYQAFFDRAVSAYDAIEKPARAKRDAQWIPGPRPADYGIGLGESES